VSARWEDLATRARGLATHLLSAADLDALARATDLSALRDALRAHDMLPAAGPVTPDGLEQAVRRAAAARLRTLARWGRGGRRNELLAVVFEDEDRHSLRAILRGALQHAPPAQRITGLIATPTLPERALATLSELPTPIAIATVLAAWGNPYGRALYRDAAGATPSILALEFRLTETFASRALRGARAAGGTVLLEYVQETIDLENASAALVLASAETEIPPKLAFVPGGKRLELSAFLDAVRARETSEAGRRLAAAFRPDPVASVFARDASDPAALEDGLLRKRIARQQAVAALDPAGPASVLGYTLALRAEVLDLRRVIWGVALDAPRTAITRALVSA
jgi:vacuolar-type H+-ATPase subunit C/Vma6